MTGHSWQQLMHTYMAQLDLLGMSFPWEQGRHPRGKVVPDTFEILGSVVGVK